MAPAFNLQIFFFFFSQIILCILCIVVVLELGRVATFLFYEKDKTRMSKKSILSPLAGRKIFSPKNIFLTCICVPTFYLFLSFLGIGSKVRLSDINIPFIISWYSLAFISFFLITAASGTERKLQLEISSRTQAKFLFIVELLLLIALFYIILKFNQFDI